MNDPVHFNFSLFTFRFSLQKARSIFGELVRPREMNDCILRKGFREEVRMEDLCKDLNTIDNARTRSAKIRISVRIIDMPATHGFQVVPMGILLQHGAFAER